ALGKEIVAQVQQQLLENAFHRWITRRQLEVVTLLRFVSGNVKGVLNIFQIKRSRNGGNGGIKWRAFGQRIMLGRFEVRIINPKLLSVTHGDARGVTFAFDAVFVGGLKPNFSTAVDRLVQQVNLSLFLEVGLHTWSGGALLANAFEQALDVGGR